MNAPWWRPPWRRPPSAAAGPGSHLFGRIRLRLTLLYCGVLAGALLIFGALLYLGVRQMLFNPIQNDLARRADRLSVAWQVAPDLSCTPNSFGPRLLLPGSPALRGHQPPLGLGARGPVYAACFGTDGVSGSGSASTPSPFLANGLAIAALRNGSSSDMVDGGEGVGTIFRYAVAVPDPSGSGMLGVIQLGEPVEGQVAALHALLTLLLLLGGLSLFVAALAGLILSGRALAPAHLAFSRQQGFIAAAAHELRTPLTLLRADAEVLLRGKARLPAEDAELLEDIVAETAHMSTLATNMLTLARLDSGQAHLEQEVVDLAAMVAGLIRRVSALADERSVSVTADCEPGVLVLGDKLLLEQALLVLIDNAIKYNRPGGAVSVGVRLAGRGQEAILEVCDSGIGIPHEHLPRLGERFYRVDAARSREQGGGGLGLSIARGIVSLHRGSLTLTSDPGRGTRATIALAAADRPHLA